jgi:quinol monooxygenase YgiN
MVVGTVRLVPAPDRREEVLEVLRSVQGPLRAQPGCVSCDIYEETGGERGVVLIERWESEASFESHLRSEAYRRILMAMEISGGRPDVRFERVSDSEGLELIERLRGS